MAAEKETGNNLRLKVGELTAREEAGRGIIRLDSNTMNKLGIREGDVIEIEGNKKTAAIAVRAYPADVGLNIIRMDGITRRNCGSGVGEFVKVKKADVKEARKVTIAPAERGMIIHISPNLIKQNIYMRPVTKGDVIIPSPVVRRRARGGNIFEEFFGVDFDDFFFTPFPGETRFVVTNTEPATIVKITDITDLEILPELPESMKLEERAVPAVTYEDIGGMRGVTQKVREMIELPLRHPELFERLGVEPPKGVLLYGPPGTGKTLLAKAVANESGANFISISGPEVMCVSKETPIILNHAGIVEAGEVSRLVEGDHKVVSGYKSFYPNSKLKVFSLNEKMGITKDEVEYVVEVPVKKVYKIKLENGNEVEVSENQPFLVINNLGETGWKKAKDLKENDYVAFVTKLTEGQKQKLEWWKFVENTFVKSDKGWITLSQYNRRFDDVKVAYSSTKSNFSKMKEIKLPVETSPDLLEFLGYMYSEGSISDEEVAISNYDERIRKRAKELFMNLFEFGEERVGESKDKIVVYSKMLAEFLKKIFNFPEGKKGIELEISPIIFKCSREEIAKFLKAYIEGDGTIAFSKEGYPTFRYFSISKKVLLGIKTLLTILGIRSKIDIWKTKLSKLWMLEILDGEGRKKFFDIVKPEKQMERMQNYFAKEHEFKDSVPLPIHALFRKLKEIEKIRYGKEIKESSIEPYISGRKLLTIPKAREILELMKPNVRSQDGLKILEKIESLLSSDLGWIKILKVEIENKKTDLIDFGIKENSNFVEAENMLILHNSKWYGQSEENLRKIFEEAEKNAPSIIFIDEIDSIAPKREEVTGEVERRVVSQLLTLLDGLKKRGKVIVIAATNRPNAIDPALRRGGRFDREIEIPVPDRNGRLEILKIHTRNMPLEKSVDLNWLADITYGYVGADLWSLAKEAAMSALRRVLPDIKWRDESELPKEIMEKLVVRKEDFQEALKVVEPSAMREVLVEVPKVKWNDIGGLEDVKQALIEMVEWPLKNPDSFERMGIEPPRGILLYGPPGTGKTLLAKAVANESGANFISVKGPELKSKWVGESERMIRDLFRRARQVAPTVIFFDEIDALAPRRGTSAGEHVTESIVSQLLTELSGLEELKGVVVIAATNRPDIIDPGLLRPGRFDRYVMVPPPEEKARLEILKVHTKEVPLKNVDLNKVAKATEGMSGADLEALVREAAMNSLRENMDSKEVKMKHFEESLKKMTPSISKEVRAHYERFVERQRKVHEREEEIASYIG